MKLIVDIETIPVEPIPWKVLGEERERLEEEYKKTETVEKYMGDFIENKWPFDPEGAKVICVGWWPLEEVDGYSSNLNYSEDIEGLEIFLNNINVTPTIVGCNVKGFDWFILSKTLKLNKPPGRYNFIDLCQEPYGYARGKRYSLKKLCRIYGVTPPVGDGAKVAELYKAGDMESIKAHCIDDVRATGEVFNRISQSYNFG